MTGAPILHLLSNWRWTGPSEPAVNLAAALHRRGWPVTFSCGREQHPVFRDEPTTVRRRARDAGVPVREGLALRKHTSLWPTLRDAHLLRGWLEGDRYDLIHCHQRNAQVVAALATRRHAQRPVIVRSSYAAAGPQGLRERWLLGRHTDGLIVVSEAARRRAVEELGFPSERTRLIEGAIDLERFDPERVPGDRRAALGLGVEHFVVGLVARIQRRRRFDVLLEAVDRARRELPDLRVLLIGRGTHMQSVAVDPIRKLGLGDTVLLPGYQTGDDYVRMIGSLDAKVYMVPGTDGSCRAVREAFAMGVPVIAPPLGPLPELIGGDERGLLFDGGAPDLARALVQLGVDRDACAAMGARARSFARDQFALARQAGQVEDLYRDLLAQGRKPEPASSA